MRTVLTHTFILKWFVVLGFVGMDSTVGFAQSPPLSTEAVVVIENMEKCCPDGAWPEAQDAIRAELGLLNIQVVEAVPLEDFSEDLLNGLISLAVTQDAIAAIRVVRIDDEDNEAPRVALWIADRATGKLTYRTIQVRDFSLAGAAMVAVRTVETFRASLLELKVKREEPAPTLTPQPITELVEQTPLVDSSSSTITPAPIRGGMGAYGSFGGTPGLDGVRSGFGMILDIRPRHWLDVVINWQLIPFGPSVSGNMATSSVDYMMFDGWALFQLFGVRKARGSLGVGGGGVVVWSKGTLADNRRLENEQTTVGTLGSMGRLELILTSRVSVLAGVRIMILLPEVAIFHGDVKAAQMGRPLIDGFGGVQIWF